MRCGNCGNGMIFALNMLSCIPCGLNCNSCFYARNMQVQYISAVPLLSNSNADLPSYFLRCSECNEGYYYSLNAVDCQRCIINGVEVNCKG